MDAKNLQFLTKEVSADKPTGGTGKESANFFSGAGFSKAERLCSQKLIASLFEAGQSFFIPGLKVIYAKTKLDSPSPVQLMLSVPKRSFPNATDRNRLRRLLRESYRRNKLPLYDCLHSNHLQLAVVIIYTSKKITTFNDVENKIKLVLSRLTQECVH